jgi:FtsH-binding integral membrane protein
MKKDYRKVYWTIAIIWGVIASICAIAYALLFDKDAPIDSQTSAMAVWNVAYWSVITLLGASLLVAIFFALAQIIKGLKEDPKKQMGIIIAVVALVVVFVVSYLLSSGTDVPQEVFEKTGSDYLSSKLIGACMYTVYILFGGVIASVLFAEVSKKIK